MRACSGHAGGSTQETKKGKGSGGHWSRFLGHFFRQRSICRTKEADFLSNLASNFPQSCQGGLYQPQRLTGESPVNLNINPILSDTEEGKPGADFLIDGSTSL